MTRRPPIKKKTADCAENAFVCFPRIAVIEEKQRATDEKIEKIDNGIEDIKKTLARQRGFYAGVTFIISIIAFFLKEFWQRLAGP